MKNLSIKDIAAMANVSITTVSFILNGKAKEKSISDAVIKKVQKIIEESGYRPNQTARSLRTGNSNIIGLIVEDISNSFFSSIARLIEDKAYKKGYKIIYSSTENSIAKSRDLIDLFKSRNVDAYIIAPMKGIEEDIQLLINDKKPVILFDRNLPDLATNYVGANHYSASYEAVETFVKNDKKNIAFVTIDVDVQQVAERFDAYKKVLEDNDIPFNEQLVLQLPFNETPENANKQLTELFSNQNIDAVFFATNYLALSGLKVLKQLNKKVNGDFSVIAYDDHEAFELHTPSIPSIHQPLEEIADAIVNLIFAQLSSKKQIPEQHIILPAKLVLRS